MIEIYTGFVGSGKSYAATARGISFAEASLGNGHVIANFPILPRKESFFRKSIKKLFKLKEKKTRWTFLDNDWITPRFLVDESVKNGWNEKKDVSCLLILDEAGIIFNARDWNIKPDERKEWIKFFSQSRKFGYDIILIAQDVRMIDRQIRSLAEYEVQHKKMNNWFIFKILPITIFAQVSFWNGIRTVRGSLKIVPFRKKIANRYDTLGLFQYEKTLKGGETNG